MRISRGGHCLSVSQQPANDRQRGSVDSDRRFPIAGTRSRTSIWLWGTGSAREIDVVIIGERRIFVVDIKDLYGRIESGDGGWTVGGSDFESSPVAKVNDIARNIYILLKPAMAKRPSGPLPGRYGNHVGARICGGDLTTRSAQSPCRSKS
jgi:Nuclease-related domain